MGTATRAQPKGGTVPAVQYGSGPGALANAMQGRMQAMPYNVASGAAGPGAQSPIMSQQQIQDFLGGGQVATGQAQQPMNNPFGNQAAVMPQQPGPGMAFGGNQGVNWGQMAAGVPGAAGYNPPGAPTQVGQNVLTHGSGMYGDNTGMMPINTTSPGNEGNRTVTATPAQQAQAAADAAQATAQGHGLGGGHHLVMQDGSSYAPGVAYGGPGGNTATQWGNVYQRMATQNAR